MEIDFVWRFLCGRAGRFTAANGGFRPEPEIHRVDPEFGSTLRLLYGDFQSNCWVNLRILGQPCEFYLPGSVDQPRVGDVRLRDAARRAVHQPD